MSLCTICGKAIRLVPSAKERARRYGGNPSDYTRLFTTHSECELEKRKSDTDELMKKISAASSRSK